MGFYIQVFVPQALAVLANQVFSQVGGISGDVVTVPCSPSGAGSATYLAGSIYLTDPTGQELIAAIATITGGRYYKCQPNEEFTQLSLVATSSLTAQSSIGQTWTFDQSLADSNLKKVMPDDGF